MQTSLLISCLSHLRHLMHVRSHYVAVLSICVMRAETPNNRHAPRVPAARETGRRMIGAWRTLASQPQPQRPQMGGTCRNIHIGTGDNRRLSLTECSVSSTVTASVCMTIVAQLAFVSDLTLQER